MDALVGNIGINVLSKDASTCRLRKPGLNDRAADWQMPALSPWPTQSEFCSLNH